MGQIIITNPHPFSERIVAFGEAGVGKSSLTLSMARAMPYAQFHTIDLDYSAAYQRLLYTEYGDVLERGNVHVHECEADWDAFTKVLAQVVREGDPATDVITIDPMTLTWQLVQAWYSDLVYGENIADHMVKVRKEAKDTSDYNKLLMQEGKWPIINKTYQQYLYNVTQKWRGHIIYCCEAGEIRRDDDAKLQSMFKSVGHKPEGQKTLPYIARTTLFLDHPRRDQWRMTTLKDTGRGLVDKMPFGDFATDYLVNIAGWEQEYSRD